MKNSITVLIYTHNEEKNIIDCIKSAHLLSDMVVVIDSESTDKTVELAKKQNAEVFTFPYSLYVEPAREFGIKKAKTDWVFILDADERITPELAEEVINVIARSETTKQSQNNKEIATLSRQTRFARNDKISYYKIPRKNIFIDKWLKHGGWSPDYQIRLINTKAFVSWPEQIHSTPLIKGECGFLKNPLLHYFHGNLEEMVKKTITFENIESDLLYKAKKSVSTMIFFRKFFGELFRRLIKEKGFLDGTIGVIESIYQSYSKTITYIYLFEKKFNKIK
jgi:glycosyltransferase involved in cell wall biosynthesis